MWRYKIIWWIQLIYSKMVKKEWQLILRMIWNQVKLLKDFDLFQILIIFQSQLCMIVNSLISFSAKRRKQETKWVFILGWIFHVSSFSNGNEIEGIKFLNYRFTKLFCQWHFLLWRVQGKIFTIFTYHFPSFINFVVVLTFLFMKEH